MYMTTKETNSELYYSKFIERISSLLKLSLSRIKEEYADYSICLMDYIEKDIHEKPIEIRLDNKEVTLTCAFDNDENCDSVSLFLDKDKQIEGFVSYLVDNHDYSFYKSRFSLPNCYAKVKELKELPDNTCLVFFQ